MVVSSPPTLPTVVTSQQWPLSALNTTPSASGSKHVLVAPGLPCLSQRIIDKIVAGEYVDFSELPPVRGLSRSLPPYLEGQVIVVQAEDLMASRKLIPNFETWAQCFALYAAVVISHDPSRAGDLMAYSHSIAAMAKKYPWPSWIAYDQAFREESAGIPGRLWGKEDFSIYARCFNWGPVAPADGCWICQSLEHQADRCPLKPPSLKRPRMERKGRSEEPCRKFNNNDGYCSFGAKCRFPHKCFTCGGPHPYTRCPRSSARRDQGKDKKH